MAIVFVALRDASLYRSGMSLTALVIMARLRGKSKKTAADLIIAAVDGVISV